MSAPFFNILPQKALAIYQCNPASNVSAKFVGVVAMVRMRRKDEILRFEGRNLKEDFQVNISENVRERSE